MFKTLSQWLSVIGLGIAAVLLAPATADSTVSAAPLDQSAACPTDKFMDVSKTAGPGGSYPMPTLKVTCNGATMTVTSNGIPHYKFTQTTPNALKVSNQNFNIPLSPQIASQPTAAMFTGIVGVGINGLPLNTAFEAANPANQAYGDAVYNAILDNCMGHTSPQDYHYHALVEACFNANYKKGQASQILGYALDGFPIYGSYGCVDAACTKVIEFKSSWDRTGNPTTYGARAYTFTQKQGEQYLDQCNGRVGPDGTYRYHATSGFPYIIGCFKGTVTLRTPPGGGQGGQGGGQGGGTGMPPAPPRR
jgi:hypothetical protein